MDIVDLINKQVNVLDKGFVTLIDQLPHPRSAVSADMAVVNAARVSFLSESKGAEKDQHLIEYMMKHKHTSPFEQVVFKFMINAPLVTWWQWNRHRTQSYNFQSGRYTEFDESSMYVPEVWRKQAKNGNKQMSDGVLSTEDSNTLSRLLSEHYFTGWNLYQKAINYGVAREQARLFLPGFSVYYRAIVSVDAHNLMHFLKLRTAPEAQYEIRVYAETVYKEFFKPIMPWTAEAYERYILESNGVSNTN